MDKEKAKKFQKELDKFLISLKKSTGLEFHYRSIRYSGSSLSVKIEGFELKKGETNGYNPRFLEDFKKYKDLFNLQDSDLYSCDSEGKKLIGIDMRKRKYPIIYEREGKLYKTSSWKKS